MKSQVIIPARLRSTRLPEKLLLDETGKTVIQHTYESALQAKRPCGVVIATDHDKIVNAVEAFHGQVVLTDPQASSGTDRVAEVAENLPDVDIIVNVQGDEPEIKGTSIDMVIQLLEENPEAVMATLGTPIRNRIQLEDPGCVKVVFNQLQQAIYFSRSVIPHPRNWDDSQLQADPPFFYQHIGLYAYRRDFLLTLARMPPSPLETVESLEQLRVLDNGFTILVGVVNEPTAGIDTKDDYQAFVRRFNSR